MRDATVEAVRAHEAAQTRTTMRVLVEDGDGNYRDLRSIFGADYLLSAKVGDSVDQQAILATVRLRSRVGDLSVSPLAENRINLLLSDGNTIMPLITKGRGIRIEALTLAQNSNVEPTSLEWAAGRIFTGIVDTCAFGSDPVEITARDEFCSILQDRWIESDNAQVDGVPADGNPNYLMGSDTGTLMGVVMNALIAEWADAFTSVYEPPTATSFVLLEYIPAIGPVMDELQRLADQIGWTIKTEWDDGTSAFRLTLRNPTRSKTTPDIIYDGLNQVRSYEDLSDDITSIRNVVSIIYRDEAASAPDRLVKRVVERSNAASITAFGRRWMQVQEADTSNIDTQAEAEAMADAILSDLSQSAIAGQIVVSYDLRVQLHDLIRCTPDNDRFDANLDLFVTGYTHSFNENGDATTSLQLQGAPASGVVRHLDDMFARPGGPEIVSGLRPLSSAPTFSPRPGGGEVRTTFVDNPRLGGRPFDYEIHEAGTSGFAATEGTLVYRPRTTGVRLSGNPGETSYFRVVPLSEDGFGADEETGTFSGTFGYAGPHLLNPSIDSGRLVDYGFDVTSRFPTLAHPDSWPPDNWTMRAGTWDVDAELSGTRLSGEYSLQQWDCDMVSRLIPVRELVPYRLDFSYQFRYGSDDASHQLSWDIEWYDTSAAGASPIALTSNAEIPFDESLTEDTWYARSTRTTAPTGARFARIALITGGDPDGYNLIDRTELSAFPESFFAYLDATDDFNANEWHPIRCTSEIFDYGSMYDATGDFRAEIRVPGLYEFSVGARVEAGPAINFIALRLERNAVVIAEQMVDCLTASEELGYAQLMLASGPIDMEEGDEVTAYVYADLGSTGTPDLASGTGNTWMRGRRLV